MQHNSHSSAWTAVGGKVYDITDFLNRHPGGYSAISRAIGKDGTNVFSKTQKSLLTYHKIGDGHGSKNPETFLAKFEIGVLKK